MSSLSLELQKLSPTAIIDLYEFDLTPDDVGSTNKFYFVPSTNEASADVTWQGQVYAACPIEVSGFERSIGGQLPRIKVKFANTNSFFSALVLSWDDMLGAKLTRHRTFSKFLDAVNFVGGVNPNADPAVYLDDDIFYLEQKNSENKVMIELEFASKFDVEGVMLPRRQVTANSCQWRYRGAECGYTGPVKTEATGATIVITPNNSYPFPEWSAVVSYVPGDCVWYLIPEKVFICSGANTNNPPTTALYWKEDACPKRLADCKLHHGTGGVLTFGAFPGVAKVQ